MRRGAALLTLAVLLATLAVPQAAAHASRLSCSPEPGARLDEAPAQVVVVLTEPIEAQGTTMTVVDHMGMRVDQDDLVVDHGQTPRLTLSIQPDLPGGAYTIAWKVLSKDTHTVSESCGFAVGAFQPPDSTQDHRQNVDAEAVVARALVYSGLALALGAFGLLLARAPGPATLAAALTRAIALGAALHTAGILLLVHYTMGESGLALSSFLDSGVGRNMAARLVAGLAALAVAGLAIVRPTRAGPVVASMAMVGAAYGSSAYSHSFAYGPAAVAMDLLHLVASATWVGALVLFLVLLGRGVRMSADEALRFGMRFGTLALGCVVVLFLAGTTVSLILLGKDAVLHPGSTLATAYGKFLAAKVALALAMVAVAAANRFVLLAPPATAGVSGSLQRAARRFGPGFAPLPTSGTGGLRRLVAVEGVIGVVVLVLAGALTSVSPPVEATVPHGDMLHLHGVGADFEVLAMMQPPPVVGGSSSITLVLVDLVTGESVVANTCDSTGTRDTCVDVLIAAGNGTSGGDRHLALPDGEGGWLVEDVLWTFSGNATATVRIQTAEVFQDSVALAFRIA